MGVTAVWGFTFFLIRDLFVVHVPACGPPRGVLRHLCGRRGQFCRVAVLAIRRAHACDAPTAWVLGGIYGSAPSCSRPSASRTTLASVSGFVADGMYVVLTPLFCAVLLLDRIGRLHLALAVASGDSLAGGAFCGGSASVGYGESSPWPRPASTPCTSSGPGRYLDPAPPPGWRRRRRGHRRGGAGRGALPGGVTACPRRRASGPRCSTWRWSPGPLHCGRRRGRSRTCQPPEPPS